MGDSPIPSRAEIVKDLIKWFAGEYGVDLAEKMFETMDMAKLTEVWKKTKGAQAKPSSGSGFGMGVLFLAYLALSDGKRSRGRRRR